MKTIIEDVLKAFHLSAARSASPDDEWIDIISKGWREAQTGIRTYVGRVEHRMEFRKASKDMEVQEPQEKAGEKKCK